MKTNKVYTIGYGNEKMDSFINKLKENEIDILIDVRSAPYSKWRPEFNSPKLREVVNSNNISYEWRGKNLGGFGINNHKLGIEEIIPLIENHKICLMCSEENPDKCHRKQNLAPILENEGFEVVHIRIKKEEKKTMCLL